ncbi:MAG TPA: DUF885 domain-containing protein [Blastocatellia bacterium]|nr:DUF885 domain-containing protein [Blastocatellia bacterium]
MSTVADSKADFNKLVDQFFDVFFKYNPTFATSSGFHQYDSQLEDYSRAGVDAQTADLKTWLAKFEKFNAAGLDQETISDREIVIANIKSALLEFENIRQWEKNPDRYSSGITNSAFVIMSRTFAPPDQRLKSLIARERQMPKVFDAARANLKNPPKIYTEVAIEQVPGIVSFFQNDVPSAFKDVKDEKLLSEFKTANQAVIDALNNYQTFLKNDLLPRSNGDFRIGADNYRKKLEYDEMVDIPLDRLLKIGYDNLHANQEWFKQTAAKVDSSKTPQQILDEMTKDHPAPDKLLQSMRDVLGDLRQYIVDHKIITIPSPVMPIVEETPPFERALTTASMDTPGPYETVAKEAYYNVTLPEPTWTPQQTEEYMEGFSRGTIISTSVHEAFPGHYVQFLWVQHAPSKVRKLLGCGSNAEGWAHYTEQMMLDQGYGNGDLKLRLGQLQDALLRNARYIVGIQMHTGNMTFEQGVDFFVKEGYQTRENAIRETKRGTSDPTYLVYTLGKLEIMKLRDDYKKMRGDKFSLEEFHDSFMKQGFPPIKVIRRAMLGNDSPVL